MQLKCRLENVETSADEKMYIDNRYQSLTNYVQINIRKIKLYPRVWVLVSGDLLYSIVLNGALDKLQVLLDTP
jgi:hypothetical protein